MKKYLRLNISPFLWAVAFSLAATIFGISVQFVKGALLDLAIIRSFEAALGMGLALGLLIALELLFFYLSDRSRGSFVVAVMAMLRGDFMESLLARDYMDYLKLREGEYISKYTQEMEALESQYFETLPRLFEIIIRIFLVSVSLFVLDYRIALVTLFLLTLPLYVPKLLERKLQRSQQAYLEQWEEHLALLSGWLGNFELIKNFSLAEKIGQRFRVSKDLTMARNLDKRYMTYLGTSLSAVLSYMSHFVILVFAAYLLLKGDFSAGDFFVAVGMIDQLSYPIISLSYFLQDVLAINPLGESTLAFINWEKTRKIKKNLAAGDFVELRIRDLNFSYEGGGKVLEDFNFCLKRGEKILLQGKSGSGKTSLINLILGYHRPCGGSIELNGLPLEEVANLTELISPMRQDARLFNDSLRNNLSLYSQVKDERLIELLGKLGLEKFANKKSLDMLVDEGGENLSGGEKRRISLARTFLRDSPILILDEPLANLDGASARLIEDFLVEIQGKTILVVSHDFSNQKLGAFDEIYHLS